MQGSVHGAPRARLRSSLASARARGSASLAVALAVHAMVGLAAARLSTPRAPAPPVSEASLVWITATEPRDAPGPAPARVEASAQAPTPDRPRSRSRAGASLASADPAAVGPAPAGSSSIEPGPMDPAAVVIGSEPHAASLAEPIEAGEREVPRVFDLDPGRVARALVASEAVGPIAAPQTGAPVGPRVRGERATERRFDDDLRRAAMAKGYVSRRGPIHLAPHPDGTFTYDGSGFDATIRPDGTVVFRDRDDATIDTPTLGQTQPMTDVTGAPLESAPLFRDAPIAGIQIGGTFDGDSALARARGEDPHRFERERFLEETEDLRARLEDRARARDLARADRRRRAARDAGPP